jgi:hypothetical protein
MTDSTEIVTGVRVPEWELGADFERGSLAHLAEGLRNLLWTDPSLFADTEVLIVRVGGTHRQAREPAIEVKSWQPGVPYETIRITPSLLEQLKRVRKTNLPAKQYASWPCDCDEYCDQDHGEGRLDLYVLQPSFHEQAVALSDTDPR